MSKQQDFIKQVKDGAITSMNKYKVCASVTIAQAILESGWGRSSLSIKGYNLFGVKADSSWKGPKVTMKTAEYTRNNEKYYIDAAFRKYSSFAASIEDHALFLVNNSRYKKNGLFNSLDYKKQTAALQQAGYATSPTYSEMLNEIIEQYSLGKYDNQQVKATSAILTQGIVTADVLNVRSSASINVNNVIGQLRKGDKVKIAKKVNGFYDIYFGDHGGYVSAEFIK